MRRGTFIYLSTYLTLGGAGLLLGPEVALRLLGATGTYGDIMPRVVGMFMLALGGLVAQFVRFDDYRYYSYAIAARVGIVTVLGWLYLRSRDPVFLTLEAIVLTGLVPSIYVALRARSAKA